jgi:hypothetical protein
VYGAVSVRAYRLESTVAQYPRAVVGDGLLRYLAFLENQQDPLVVEHGTACRNLLCTAPDDGIYMLHLLAPEVLASGPHHHELPHRALAWITRELHAHRSANNHRLTERYTRLLTYFAANGYAVTSEGASSQQGL